MKLTIVYYIALCSFLVDAGPKKNKEIVAGTSDHLDDFDAHMWSTYFDELEKEHGGPSNPVETGENKKNEVDPRRKYLGEGAQWIPLKNYGSQNVDFEFWPKRTRELNNDGGVRSNPVYIGNDRSPIIGNIGKSKGVMEAAQNNAYAIYPEANRNTDTYIKLFQQWLEKYAPRTTLFFIEGRIMRSLLTHRFFGRGQVQFTEDEMKLALERFVNLYFKMSGKELKCPISEHTFTTINWTLNKKSGVALKTMCEYNKTLVTLMTFVNHSESVGFMFAYTILREYVNANNAAFDMSKIFSTNTDTYGMLIHNF